MRLIIWTLIIVLAGVMPAGGVNYFVSPSGNDGNDGLDSTTAWASIDRGDQLALLVSGDTVNVMPGTYLPSSSIQLKTNGTAPLPIIYRKFVTEDVIIDGNNQDYALIQIDGNYVIVDGFEITNTQKEGIVIGGDGCQIYNCYIHNLDEIGIKSATDDHIFYGNIMAHTGSDGIEIDGENCLTYNNTVYYSGNRGIHYKAGVSAGRIFNNISIGNNEGIRGKETLVCGFNLVWDNSSDYTNGVIDSAGGISADPLFINAVGGDFTLQPTSPCIDTALNIGYPYHGTAPDMGAIEYILFNELPILTAIGSQSTTENINLNFGILASDDKSTPVLTTSTLPTGASFVDNADGTGDFDWTPTYLQSGSYDVTFYATDDSSAVDSELIN
ncbi:MAG: hypothetical protein GY841_22200, partial [FCB group bacterium]|nr:hypothetical protein [FCB group bacterium]